MSRLELSEDEREAIREAVAEVESVSGAEVVPVMAERSDDYRLADWRAAALGALIGGGAAPWLPDLVGWSAAAPLVPLAWLLAGSLVGVSIARWPVARRRLAGEREVAERVAAGARDAFLANEVFRTRDRTGLLIYVSMFERRVEILADEAVYRAVPQTVWVALASEIAGKMRQSPPAAAVLVAIRRAGELVGEHGPHRRSDDRNELPDAPVER